jgi:hypothetical protein
MAAGRGGWLTIPSRDTSDSDYERARAPVVDPWRLHLIYATKKPL